LNLELVKMGESVGGGNALDLLNNSLSSVQMLRSSLAEFFQSVSSGFNVEGAAPAAKSGVWSEERERAVKVEIQHRIQKVVQNIR